MISSVEIYSFIYGKSVSNQRIEQWWSYLKANTTKSWIDYFKDFRDQGLYDDSNIIHTEALKYCYFGVLETELENVKNDWNHHSIRPSRNAETPSGRPDIMFLIPDNYGAENQGVDINFHELDIAIDMFTRQPKPLPCDDNFIELCQIIESTKLERTNQ